MYQIPELKSPSSEIVQANYNKLSDHIRRLTPQGIQCSVFCGGVNCKYENPENWKADSLAIQGVYSHWITDDILAMARPSTLTIVQKNIIQQFESLCIKSIINLQSPKEHASCGQPLEESGFSYDPNVFMENNIYYYNFAWKDYGDATLQGLLNMVKVVAFAVSEGRVAIHCHAGLGRTGVLIACYLVFSLRVTANDAIRYVRLRRPGSVQTRGQILCVRHFAQFVLPRTITYYLKDNAGTDKYMNEFTLQRFLRRQRIVLHGYDERSFKYLPKIVHCLCERMLKVCGCWNSDFPPSNISLTADFLCTKLHGHIQRHESTYSLSSVTSEYFATGDLVKFPSGEMSAPPSPNPSENGDNTDSFSELSTLDGEEMSEELLIENRCFQELETQKKFGQEHSEDDTVIQDINVVTDAMLTDFANLDNDIKVKVSEYQQQINTSKLGWAMLTVENDLNVLSSLLFEWLESLKIPVISRDNLESIVILYNQPEACFQKFNTEDAYLIEYILLFISKIQAISKERQSDILKRFIAALSKHTVSINDEIMPAEKGFRKLGDGTLACAMEFFSSLLEMIETHHSQKQALCYLEENDKITDDLDFESGFH